MNTSSPNQFSELEVNKDGNYGEEHTYEVEKLIDSASAFVCIAYRRDFKEQKLVFKILREYKDERYHYASIKDRLLCQKEALRKNFQITPTIYLGLVRMWPATLLKLEEMKHTGRLQSIVLGPIVQEGKQIERISEQDGDYALVMSYVSEEQRLDLLLKEGPEKCEELLHSLASRIAQMHSTFPSFDGTKDENGIIWGSYEQLCKKLTHNLTHFEMIERYNFALYKQYAPLKEEVLPSFIRRERLQKAFEERCKGWYIKQCHGDLKTKNIWVETIKTDTLTHNVHILDAVDFNESYRNIDVLADLAMLVVDIEVMGDEKLGTLLKEKYLSLTEQTGDAARLVLAYYLLEKSIVCAIVCIVYDHCELDMGPRFLELANAYANKLRDLLNSQPSENLVQYAA